MRVPTLVAAALMATGALAQAPTGQMAPGDTASPQPSPAEPAPAHTAPAHAAPMQGSPAPAGPAAADQAPQAELRPMPENARVYIIWPPDGAVIRGGFWVRMGLSEAGVAPAGVARPHTGHHHLLVDTELPPLDQEIPNDRHHLHFGLGQTEARLELPPGRHTLQMLLGDENHVPHKPPLYSRRITVTVTP